MEGAEGKRGMESDKEDGRERGVEVGVGEKCNHQSDLNSIYKLLLDTVQLKEAKQITHGGVRGGRNVINSLNF